MADSLAPQPTPPGVRRLRRSPNRVFSGMASGIADYIQIDVKIVRIAFVVLALFSGWAALLFYFAAWALVPSATDADPRPLALTSSTPRLIGGFILLLIATLTAVDVFVGPWFLADEVIVAGALIGLGYWLLNQRSGDRTRADASVAASPGPARGNWPPPVYPSTAPPPTTGGPTTGEPLTDTVDDGATVDPLLAEALGDETAEIDARAAEIAAEREAAPWAIPLTETAVATKQPSGPPVASITLALGIVATGALLVVSNVGGVSISATVITSAIVTILGAGLVASAFATRTLVLYPLAALALAALAIAPLFDTTLAGGIGTRDIVVADVAALEDVYAVGLGELQLDLRQLTLTEDETIEVSVGSGYAEITLPRNLPVEIRATNRAGYIEVLDVVDEGVGNELTHRSDPDPASDDPKLVIDASVTFGYLEVKRG